MVIVSTLAIEEGIQNIGTGKRFVDCTPELVEEIITDIQEGRTPKSIQGAFLGALFYKVPTIDEIRIEEIGSMNCLRLSSAFINAFLSDTPIEIQGFAKSLLDRIDLSKGEAQRLGLFLMQTHNDFVRGFFASILRIKYETIEEYLGLMEAIEATDGLPEPRRITEPNVIQIAEPFDGTNRSFLLTPFIIEALNGKGFKSLCMCGESAGPKFGNNLLGLGRATGQEFYMGFSRTLEIPDSGLYLSQNDLFPALTKWQRIRREIKKRPFLATVEKLINPFDAQIGLFSSFHGRYSEMILDVGLQHGFKKVVGVFKALEGGLTPSMARPVHITIATQNSRGVVQKETHKFTPEDFGFTTTKMVNLENPTPLENANMIQKYLESPDQMPAPEREHIEYTKAVYARVAELLE